MDAKTFEQKIGRAPEQDELDRVNCKRAGDTGHWLCGWCDEHDKPHFQCGCTARPRTDDFPEPPPVPHAPRRKVYLAIWNQGHPVKADIFTSGFPKWKPISIEEYVYMAERFRVQHLLAEQASVNREFGHEAMGL